EERGRSGQTAGLELIARAEAPWLAGDALGVDLHPIELVLDVIVIGVREDGQEVTQEDGARGVASLEEHRREADLRIPRWHRPLAERPGLPARAVEDRACAGRRVPEPGRAGAGRAHLDVVRESTARRRHVRGGATGVAHDAGI